MGVCCSERQEKVPSITIVDFQEPTREGKENFPSDADDSIISNLKVISSSPGLDKKKRKFGGSPILLALTKSSERRKKAAQNQIII